MPRIVQPAPADVKIVTIELSPADFAAIADILGLAQEELDRMSVEPPTAVVGMMQFLGTLEKDAQ